jgi:hypothetical protein
MACARPEPSSPRQVDQGHNSLIMLLRKPFREAVIMETNEAANKFERVEKPKNLNELHHSLVENLSRIEAKKPRSIDVSWRNKNELVIRAKLNELKQKKITIVVMPDILLFRKDDPSKSLAVDLKWFSHSATNSREYFEVKLVPKDVTDELKLYFATSTKAPPETLYAASRVLNTAVKPLQTVFVTRALNAVAHLSEELGETFLAAANAAPSDFYVLLRALENPETADELRKHDPLLPARIRGIEAKQKLLEIEGGSFGVEQVAKILSISRQAVDKRRRLGRLIAVSRGRRGYVYPAWQFGGSGLVPGLERILQILHAHDAWMQIAFMLNANTRLKGRRPLDELRSGKVESVLEAARAYGEQGAA